MSRDTDLLVAANPITHHLELKRGQTRRWRDLKQSYIQVSGSRESSASVPSEKSDLVAISGASSSISFDREIVATAEVAEPAYVEKRVNDNDAISELIITSAGVVEDHWTFRQNIPAMIVDYNEDVVTMECMIDEGNLKTQKRLFKTELLKGAIELERESLVLIKTYQRPGHLNIEFVNGKGLFRSNLFIDATEKEKAFAGIEKGIFDKPIKFPAKKK